MSTHAVPHIATGRVDGEGRLTEAGEPLASLQRACGGQDGGPLAIPELRAIALKAAGLRLRLSRPFQAHAGAERIRAWVDADPDSGGGCTLAIAGWHAEAVSPRDESAELTRVQRELNRVLPEFVARLDARQRVVAVESEAPDLVELSEAMRAGLGRPWTEFVALPGIIHDQPLHWRLLDGAQCEAPGSLRRWTAWLEPLGMPEPGSQGFVLTLVSDEAAPRAEDAPESAGSSLPSLGEELAPALRQPVTRVIAQAESIRSKLAGPLAEIYAGYAGDMVDAGQHLLALIEDIADLEGVEAAGFKVEVEPIDLAAAARQACGILGARAQERDIQLVPPAAGESLWALGEFRRVLQILINLVGNAIAYSPEESQVWVRLDREGRTALVTVADQGRGLSREEQARVFEKFERLGRSGDGGSGLGLYIAARLAKAMQGRLSVESAPGQGARFTLALPATA